MRVCRQAEAGLPGSAAVRFARRMSRAFVASSVGGFATGGASMSRPMADTPAYVAEPEGLEKEGGRWGALSLEIQLWVEVLLLVLIGFIMIFSASSIVALKKFSDPTHYLKRQMVCVLLGVGGMIALSRIHYKVYKEYAGYALVAAMVALLLVLVPGVGSELNNARRWFHLKGFLLQPAEFAKVVWVLYLSVSLWRKQDRIKQMRVSFWPHIILCGILSALILKEPDFGTTVLIGSLTVVLMATGGVPCRSLVILLPVVAAGVYKFVYLVPWRLERVTAFWNPWTDPLDTGYQLIQAWIAVGTGGLWGKGLGAGELKLFYLPEPFTDFILAVIGEELGLVGITAVCVLFFFLFRTGLHISRNSPDQFGSLLALGLTMLITLQALLNMGVVLGLFPTKGLPLPFISYGGSAFTANCLAMGMLMSVARNTEQRTG